MVDMAEEYREKMLDAISMFDDEIMEMYMEGEEIPVEKLRCLQNKENHPYYHPFQEFAVNL